MFVILINVFEYVRMFLINKIWCFIYYMKLCECDSEVF